MLQRWVCASGQGAGIACDFRRYAPTEVSGRYRNKPEGNPFGAVETPLSTQCEFWNYLSSRLADYEAVPGGIDDFDSDTFHLIDG
jgi:hypothetical protein